MLLSPAEKLQCNQLHVLSCDRNGILPRHANNKSEFPNPLVIAKSRPLRKMLTCVLATLAAYYKHPHGKHKGQSGSLQGTSGQFNGANGRRGGGGRK